MRTPTFQHHAAPRPVLPAQFRRQELTLLLTRLHPRVVDRDKELVGGNVGARPVDGARQRVADGLVNNVEAPSGAAEVGRDVGCRRHDLVDDALEGQERGRRGGDLAPAGRLSSMERRPLVATSQVPEWVVRG